MIKINLLVISIIVFSCGLIIYYFIFTSNGSTLILKSALSKYAGSKSINIKESQGSLGRTLVLYDLEIKDSKFLRHSNFIRIQRLEVYFKSFNLSRINIRVHNGRLELPASGLIVFQGSLTDNILEANIYSGALNVKGLLGFLPEIKELVGMSGSITDIDIYLKEKTSEPKLSGKFRIENLTRSGLTLSNCPVLFDLQAKEINREAKLNGTISLNSGVISGPKTALINLGEGKVSFFGEPKKASLDLSGSSNVEGTKINIALKGTLDKPELRLASDSLLPQERLLVMLLTGKSWKATETALYKGQFSPNLAKDFLDYFVFFGSGSKIAQRLGISDISVTLEQEKKGVGVKKAITEKIDASYKIEQSQAKEEAPVITQKVGGEYKITESISIEAEKELKQGNQTGVSAQEQQADDKVMIKFKKTF